MGYLYKIRSDTLEKPEVIYCQYWAITYNLHFFVEDSHMHNLDKAT